MTSVNTGRPHAQRLRQDLEEVRGQLLEVVQGLTSPNAESIGIETYQCCFGSPTWEPWEYIGTNTITRHWGGYTQPLPDGGDFYEEFGPGSCCNVNADYDLGYLY